MRRLVLLLHAAVIVSLACDDDEDTTANVAPPPVAETAAAPPPPPPAPAPPADPPAAAEPTGVASIFTWLGEGLSAVPGEACASMKSTDARSVAAGDLPAVGNLVRVPMPGVEDDTEEWYCDEFTVVPETTYTHAVVLVRDDVVTGVYMTSQEDADADWAKGDELLSAICETRRVINPEVLAWEGCGPADQFASMQRDPNELIIWLAPDYDTYVSFIEGGH